MSGKCEGGFELPDYDDEPCPECGATWRDRCRFAERKDRLRQWLDLLPKDVQIDVDMALSKLWEVMNREIEQAYFDGHNHHRDQELAAKYREAALKTAQGKQE